MDKLNWTTGLILVTAVVWLGYDIYAYLTNGVTTISAEIVAFSWYSPLAPFALGMIMGHFYWPYCREESK